MAKTPRIKVKCAECGTIFWYKKGQSKCPRCGSVDVSHWAAKGRSITNLKGVSKAPSEFELWLKSIEKKLL